MEYDKILKKRWWLIAFTMVCLPQLFMLPLFSQSEYGGFENIDKKDGLYHLNTTSIYKDSKGFLWVGSTDGLMRYDGAFFDVFRRGRQDTSSLSDNSITCITEHIDEYVFWIGTKWGGLNRFDITKNSYQHFLLNASDDKKTKRISYIQPLNADTLLVGTDYSGLYFFYPSTGQFFPTNYTPASTRIYKIIKGLTNIWVLSSKGVICLDKTTGKKKYTIDIDKINVNQLFESSGASYKKIRGIVEEEDDCIVFTLGNGVYRYNHSTKELELPFIADKSVIFKDIVEDNDGNYWVASVKDGIFFCDVKEKELTNYRKDETDIYNSLIFDEVKDLQFIKDQNVLFVATKRGISKYDYHKQLFKRYAVKNLIDNYVSEVLLVFKDSEETFWVGTSSGTLFHKKNNKKKFDLFNKPDRFYSYQIIQSGEQEIHFLTDKGLYIYNLKSQEFTKKRFNGKSEDKLNHLNLGVKTNGHAIWLLSKSGLIYYNTISQEYEVFEKDFTKDIEGLIRFVSIDYSLDKKFLWLAERSGIIYKFNLETKEYEKLETNFISSTKTLIIDAEFDSNGKLWLATFGSGVLIYDPNTGAVSSELAIDELESYVYGVVFDDKEHMWISSNFGVSKVDINNYNIRTYDMDDGSIGGEFNKRTYYKGSDGTMLFGGQKGFIEFNKDEIYENSYSQIPVISAWSKKTKTTNFLDGIYDEVIYFNDTIVSYQHKKAEDVKFYVSTLNYSHSDRNTIKWKLDGHSTDWIESYASEPIVFNNLKPGRYELRVKGLNNHGVVSEQEARLRVVVIPEFYETVGFKILIAFVILGIMYLIFRVRIAWYRDQKKILVNTVAEKTSELTLANKELEGTKEEVLKQNAELHIHRNNLEELVKIRTEDLEKAKQDAEESDRLKTSFLANLSHEIRTPMNAIIGFSSLIQIGDFQEEQKLEFIKLIGQSSESLLSLIDDIIDISRIETGNVKVVYHDIHIPSFLKETLDELSFEEKSDQVSFIQQCELKSNEEYLYSDKHRLKQVLSNLIRNALKFTKAGHVKLIVKKSNLTELINLGFNLNATEEDSIDPLLFKVEDTGIGIDKSDLKIIFQPFQKATKNKELYNGMGLGLSIVKNLIVLFGGDIIVNSELGSGTTFTFYINATPVINS